MTKYEKALEVINELFGDASVSPEETARNLESLQSEIDALLETLSGEDDINYADEEGWEDDDDSAEEEVGNE